MTREIIIIILIVLIIVTGHFWEQNHLKYTSTELTNKIDGVLSELKKDGEITGKSKEQINELTNEWEKINKIWSIMVMHSELDQIELSLTAAKTAIESDNINDGLIELEKLSFLLEHIKEKESLKVKNIF